MINYTVKDIDVFTKTANIYIDGEFVFEFGYNPNDPYRNVFDQMVSGSTPIHLTDQPFPSIGMTYDGSAFQDGPNGETFIQYEEGGQDAPQRLLAVPGFEAIVSVNSDGIVDGVLIMLVYLWGSPTGVDTLFAALMSNPVIEITDGATPWPECDVAGQVIEALEVSDLEALKPIGWTG